MGTTLLLYEEDNNGLIKVESKEDLEKHGFDSSNRADTIMMKRFYTPLEVQRMKPGGRSWRRTPDDIDWRLTQRVPMQRSKI